MLRAAVPTIVIAVMLAVPAAAGTQGVSSPAIVVLTPRIGLSLPPPKPLDARAVVLISQPRPRPDGRLESTVRVLALRLPDHRSYFFAIRKPSSRRWTYLCEDEACRGPMRWTFSRRALRQMRDVPATIEVFVWRGHIWSVAGARIDGDALAPRRKVKRTASPAGHAGAPSTPRGESRPPQQGWLLTARLKPAGLTRPPRGVPDGARGSFTARVWPYGSAWVSLRATLSTHALTASARAAHIHAGAPGRNGPILVSLCSGGRCNLSGSGIAHLPRGVIDAMRTLGAYVDVHTRANPRGELRGQVEIRRHGA